MRAVFWQKGLSGYRGGAGHCAAVFCNHLGAVCAAGAAGSGGHDAHLYKRSRAHRPGGRVHPHPERVLSVLGRNGGIYQRAAQRGPGDRGHGSEQCGGRPERAAERGIYFRLAGRPQNGRQRRGAGHVPFAPGRAGAVLCGIAALRARQAEILCRVCAQ